MKYTAQNGVWDDFKKKFVKPNTIDWSWTNKLMDNGLIDTETEYDYVKNEKNNRRSIIL